MRRAVGVSLALAMLGFAALACNLFPGVPVTPTIAPTVATTAAPSPTATLTASATPDPTLVPSLSASPTPSATATFTATATTTLTASPTPSATPTLITTSTTTPTMTPTATATTTLTASPTPSATPTLITTSTTTPTMTPTATATLTASSTPSATPTLITTSTTTPTMTPTATATTTLTASPTPSATLTLITTSTTTPTMTPTATATTTLTASPTPSATPTLITTSTTTPTMTPTATDTALPGPIPSDTPGPTASRTASRTASPTPTRTPEPSLTATLSLTPSATSTGTPTPTATPTVLIVLFPTSAPPTRPTATSFGIITATPLVLQPTPTGLPTLIRITTLRPTVTPAITPTPAITATPPAPTFSIPPLLVTPGASVVPTLVGAAVTPLPGGQLPGTPTPFPSLFALPGSETISVGPDQLQFPPPDTDPTAYISYAVSRDGRRAAITREGTLVVDGGIFTGELDTHLRQRFLAARWSPDGRWLAYVVQRPDAEQVGADNVVPTLNDGVWVMQWPGGRPRQVFRSFFVRGSNEWPYQAALDVAWSPDSSLIMVSVAGQSGERLTAMTSPGAVVDMPGPGLPPQSTTSFSLLPYTDGTWTPDGTAWTARTVDVGRGTALVILPRDSSQSLTVLDGPSAGLWIQNPARLPDGRYAFLGKVSLTGGLEGGATGLRLYVMNVDEAPAPVSLPIPGTIVGASWSPSRGSLLVYTLESGAYVVNVDGQTSAVVPGVPAVHWLP